MTTMLEISVRRFYTSDEATIAPKITIVIPLETLIGSATESSVDWQKMADILGKQIKGIPCTNLREMTPEEIVDYRGEEENGE